MSDHDQTSDTPESDSPKQAKTNEPWERRALFVFGVVFLVALLGLVFFVPHPSRQEWFVLLCALGLAAGAIAALLPGSIEWNVPAGLRVTGAVAVAALVVWIGNGYSPQDTPGPGKVSATISFARCATAPDDILNTDVYVAVDDKLVWADVKNHGAPDFNPAATPLVKCNSARRGPGGVAIDCWPIPLGAKLTLFVRGIQRQNREERWWRSFDLSVPAMYADMDDGSKSDFTYLLHQ